MYRERKHAAERTQHIQTLNARMQKHAPSTDTMTGPRWSSETGCPVLTSRLMVLPGKDGRKGGR